VEACAVELCLLVFPKQYGPLSIYHLCFPALSQFLSKNGIYEFWNWFDDRTWYGWTGHMNPSECDMYVRCFLLFFVLGTPLDVLLAALSILV
jgi:hypothetical protein